ncbi:MAG: PepSY domain-containing protein [Planctomycetota bacterium]
MRRLATLLLSAGTVSLAIAIAGCTSAPTANDLPAPVKATAMASVDGLHITSVEKFTEAGITFYDILGEADGTIWDMEILEDGRMLELEQAMRVNDLPETVREATLARFDGGTITGAEPYQENGTRLYELEVEHATHTYDVEIDEAGRIYSVQQAVPLDSLPGAVRNAVKRAVPGIVLLEAERGVGEEVGVFAVEGIASTRTYEVTLNEHGQVLGLDVEHDLASEEN